jgi:hypothetical protein
MEREPRTVDLKPDAQLLTAAAFELAAGLVDGGQRGMSQSLEKPHELLEACLYGKAAELAYARLHGVDPKLIRADRRGRPDFVLDGRAVDVKAARGEYVNLASGSWARMLDRGRYSIAAVIVYGPTWTAQLVGELDTTQLTAAIERGRVQLRPGRRAGGSAYYAIPLQLFREAAR